MHYIEMIRRDPGEGEYWCRLARIYEYKDQFPFALQNIDEGIRSRRKTGSSTSTASASPRGWETARTAKDYLRQWLDRHPEDREMQGIFAGADKLLEEEFGLKAPGAAERERRPESERERSS